MTGEDDLKKGFNVYTRVFVGKGWGGLFFSVWLHFFRLFFLFTCASTTVSCNLSYFWLLLSTSGESTGINKNEYEHNQKHIFFSFLGHHSRHTRKQRRLVRALQGGVAPGLTKCTRYSCLNFFNGSLVLIFCLFES